MNVQSFLNAITAELAAQFPGVASCEVYPGQFTADELSRATVKTPALRLAAYEVGRAEASASGEVDVDLGLSLVVITTDKKDLAREVAGGNLVEAITLMLAQGAAWSCDNAFAPERVAARNLYGAALSKKKVQLWEVSWRQTLRLGEPFWADEGVLPLELYVGQAPDIGPDHEADYERMGDES